ncbi:MAG: 2-C-methyl-D-erythritol 4-phosphate cytidylyltransferase, partial [Planctomycetes bacterium]|nr:2-C-methyl-D-erythritol 4-phosphate cytidylyltransferase [Planctomycetota bacterium]
MLTDETCHPGSRVFFRAAYTLACTVWLCAAIVHGADVVVETIDGTVIEGEWRGVEKSNRVRIGTGQVLRVFSFEELSTITFAGPEPTASAVADPRRLKLCGSGGVERLQYVRDRRMLAMARFAVIIPAAGKGERFGGREKKTFAKLGGKPLFIQTI